MISLLFTKRWDVNNFFQIHEMKGAGPNELTTQVDLLLYQAYPPHPHTSLSLPAIQKLSLQPILFTQVPALDTVTAKLSSFIESSPWPADATKTKAQTKQFLTSQITTYLKVRFPQGNAPGTPRPGTVAPAPVLTAWAETTMILLKALPPESIFPLVDMWRLAFLDAEVGNWYATISSTGRFVQELLAKASSSGAPRNLILTSLRMLCNTLTSPFLARQLAGDSGVAAFLVPTLLHDDAAIRTAAASLAFNLSSAIQRSRVDKLRGNKDSGVPENEDWQVEMASAIIEAIDREKENEDVGEHSFQADYWQRVSDTSSS